ncbi:MAG: hypothetical protein CO118_05985 [Flavobacteriales bacterium CG_4_9_14_3_um_filter_32_8]|nr:MAG: hypothetical protein CO118_05985 [Flavobacteriales bacterium CG_4_9_14_3_um_filter_32_8]
MYKIIIISKDKISDSIYTKVSSLKEDFINSSIKFSSSIVTIEIPFFWMFSLFRINSPIEIFAIKFRNIRI